MLSVVRVVHASEEFYACESIGKVTFFLSTEHLPRSKQAKGVLATDYPPRVTGNILMRSEAASKKTKCLCSHHHDWLFNAGRLHDVHATRS